MLEYSYLDLYFPRETSREAARQVLTEHAEYGGWDFILTADGVCGCAAGLSG